MTWLRLSIFYLASHVLIIHTNVVLYKKVFPDQPGRKYLELKCDFDLIEQDHYIEKVVISKNDNAFYSVEYFNNETVDLVNPVKKYPTNNGIPTHGISKVTKMKNEGWVAIGVKNHVPGSYKCLVFYSKTDSNDTSTFLVKESDNVAIVKEGGRVKLKIDHKTIHLGDSVKLGCQYKLLSNDSFYGLSLFKDDQEFFKYYNDQNHTFEPIEGVNNITWSSYARAIYMTVRKAVNTTGGMYGCSINYSNPHMEDKYSTVSDESKLEFRSSANRIGVVFLWLIINMFVIIR